MATVSYTYDVFTYTNKLFQANTSTLNWATGYYPDTINVIGKTGTVIQFSFSKITSGAGGTVSYDYTPTAASVAKAPDAKGSKVRIFKT